MLIFTEKYSLALASGFEVARERIDRIANELLRDSRTYDMGRAKCDRCISSPGNQGCSHCQSDEQHLQCDRTFRLSQSAELLEKAGLLKDCHAPERLSIADMIDGLESAWADSPHECQGKRDCPLQSQMQKTIVALRRLTFDAKDCDICVGEQRRMAFS
jgi:hypothetical protein